MISPARSHTEHNSALTEVDRKKERKRNFVSAKTGFITVFELVFSYFFFGIFYGFKVRTNNPRIYDVEYAQMHTL